MPRRTRTADELLISDKKSVFEFLKLPLLVQSQVDMLADHLRVHAHVLEYFERLRHLYPEITIQNEVFSGDRLQRLLLNAAVYRKVSALDVAVPSNLEYLTCYNEMGVAIIRLEKIVTEGSYVKLFRGMFLDEQYAALNCKWDYRRPVMIKLHQSKDGIHNTGFEIDVYRCLGDPRPSLGINCYLWNVPVLVMEPLEKLDTRDDENEVGIQMLEYLALVHQKTVVSDIKPDNIMRVPESGRRSDVPSNPAAMLDYRRREPYGAAPSMAGFGMGMAGVAHPQMM